MKIRGRFRGRSLYNGEWVYGDLVHISDGAIIITSSKEGPPLPDDCPYALAYTKDEFAPVDVRTVGQNTGVLDEQGRYIYEGDIIECLDSKHKPIRHVVRYDPTRCAYIQYSGEINGPVWTLYDCGGISQTYIYEMGKYLIGNVYDNPEKLKV